MVLTICSASICWHAEGKVLIIHGPQLRLALSFSSIHGGGKSTACWASSNRPSLLSPQIQAERLPPSCPLVWAGSRTRRERLICAQPYSYRPQLWGGVGIVGGARKNRGRVLCPHALFATCYGGEGQTVYPGWGGIQLGENL